MRIDAYAPIGLQLFSLFFFAFDSSPSLLLTFYSLLICRIQDRVRPVDGFYRVKVTVTSTGVLPDKSTKESPIQYNIGLSYSPHLPLPSLPLPPSLPPCLPASLPPCLPASPLNTSLAVLETLLLGAPFDVVKIGVFVAVMCVLMATILVPQLFPHLPGFNNLVD